jgi:GntR family transcriptional regulator
VTRDSLDTSIKPLQKNGLIPEQVYHYILELIRDGIFSPGQQLPSENDLAKSLNVSRLSLREALQRLDLEGFIIRKRGIGTFVLGDKPHALEPGFEKLHSLSGHIIAKGMRPGTAEIDISIEIPDEDIVSKLRLDPEDTVTVIKRLRTTDDRPLSWSMDRLPSKSFSEIPNPNDIGESLYKYLEQKWGYAIAYAKAEVTAVKGDAFQAQKLGVSEGDALIEIDQLHYLEDNTPIMHTMEWLIPEVFSIKVNRRR